MDQQTDIAAEFLLSKFHLHENSIEKFQNQNEQEAEEKEKEDSIGTGSFTTN